MSHAKRWWEWPPAPLAPLAPVYAAALALKERLHSAGVLRSSRLEWPVVSVGSLSVGGAGKTPVVIALAEGMSARGWYVDVLSRGYGRKGQGVERVRTDGENPAWWFGDEPVLIAQRTQVPVWVGAERYEAGRMAEGPAERRALKVHLLDDGFQHRRLERTMDVVLVTEQDLNDAVLPAGNLREPLKALRRADAVVVREDERERVETRVRALMREGGALWSIHRELRFPAGLNAVMRPVGFCAIARPQSFWEMVDDAGCALAAKMEFQDHYPYERADVTRLVQLAADHGADGFVTTEKDAVKLSPAMLEGLRTIGPVNIAALDARFVDEDSVLRELEERLR